MTYLIQSEVTHPLHGANFELFPIYWLGDRNGEWIRDDKNGKRWGFEHPDSGEVVAVHGAGIGSTPKLGRVSSAFTIIEMDEPPLNEELLNEMDSVIEDFVVSQIEDQEEVPPTTSLLTSSAVEMGRPELREIKKEE